MRARPGFPSWALSSTVGIKVDFDMALLVIASGLYRLLARKMRGYADFGLHV